VNIRFATPADVKECNDFHNRMYGKSRTESQWRWEFLNWKESETPFVIAEENNRVLGTQALIPVRMVDEEGEFLSAKSEETLLHPDLRGKNMFNRMYELLFKYSQNNGISVIWGFTPAVRAFEKVGFEVPSRISQLFFPLFPQSVEVLLKNKSDNVDRNFLKTIQRKCLKWGCGIGKVSSSLHFGTANFRLSFSKLGSFKIETLLTPPEESHSISRCFIKQWGGVTILRDVNYLKWRFFQNPYLRSVFRAAYLNDTLLGWIAYSVDEDSMGHIVDIMVGSEELDLRNTETVVALLISDAVKRMRKAGVLGISAWSVNEHKFDTLFAKMARRMGFFLVPRGESMVIRYMKNSPARISLLDFNNWYVNRIFTEGVLG